MIYRDLKTESPIEDIFLSEAAKHFDPSATMESQVWVETICGNFRLDFLATDKNGRKIGFECDGKEFHENKPDEWRDALILHHGGADIIYRLRGRDLYYHLNDLFYALCQFETSLFKERAVINLNILASDRVKREIADRGETRKVFVMYVPEGSRVVTEDTLMIWSSILNDRFIGVIVQFMVDQGGGDLLEIRKRWGTKGNQNWPKEAL